MSMMTQFNPEPQDLLERIRIITLSHGPEGIYHRSILLALYSNPNPASGIPNIH